MFRHVAGCLEVYGDSEDDDDGRALMTKLLGRARPAELGLPLQSVRWRFARRPAARPAEFGLQSSA